MNQWEIIRMLFNGPSKANPKEIYKGEYSLDNRIARKGMYGKGIYFANNSQYCSNFHHDLSLSQNHLSPQELEKRGRYQQFVCFVNVGKTIQIPQDKELEKPPKIPNSDEWYDSVTNINGEHVIIYDPNKQYIGYVINYN